MIQLFKKGTANVYNGMTCEMQLVDGFGFEPLLAENGGEWYLDPKDIPEETEKTEKIDEPKVVKEPEEPKEPQKVKSKPITEKKEKKDEIFFKSSTDNGTD